MIINYYIILFHKNKPILYYFLESLQFLNKYYIYYKLALYVILFFNL